MYEEAQALSANFPFVSHYADVLGRKMHYVEQGEGTPILFLHGMPTSNYLWRNVIPSIASEGRCIALDLIGMGKSDKPLIEYTTFEHIEYLNAFIEALGLQDFVMVLHGWGSVIGFDYAMKHPKNVKGIAFYESHIRPVAGWDMLSLPVKELYAIEFESVDKAKQAICQENYFIERALPAGILRTLTKEEKDAYAAPFLTEESRQPLWQYFQELPKGQGETPVFALIDAYSKKLQESPIPKLMLYATPGFITTMDTVRWASDHLPNLRLADLGDGLHYVQESNPQLMAEEIVGWIKFHL